MSLALRCRPIGLAVLVLAGCAVQGDKAAPVDLRPHLSTAVFAPTASSPPRHAFEALVKHVYGDLSAPRVVCMTTRTSDLEIPWPGSLQRLAPLVDFVENPDEADEVLTIVYWAPAMDGAGVTDARVMRRRAHELAAATFHIRQTPQGWQVE